MTNTVRKITMIGMLIAAQVITGRFISISLPIATIGFTFLPIAITGILYGPVWGGVSAVLGDLITALLGPYGYFPPMGISAPFNRNDLWFFPLSKNSQHPAYFSLCSD